MDPTGAVYKGLAPDANTANGPILYAANFRTGTIDVLDTNFHQVTLSGSFTAPHVQHGYAPFGNQDINGQLWVTVPRSGPDFEGGEQTDWAPNARVATAVNLLYPGNGTPLKVLSIAMVALAVSLIAILPFADG